MIKSHTAEVFCARKETVQINYLLPPARSIIYHSEAISEPYRIILKTFSCDRYHVCAGIAKLQEQKSSNINE